MRLLILLFFFSIIVCQDKPFIVILGTAQDAGAPQAMCQKSCCIDRWKNGNREYATSLALFSPKDQSYYLFEATPDIKYQINYVTQNFPKYTLAGVFITHAHIGHYTGLIHFGREVIGSKNLNVYVMPRMKSFLETNGPWSQLVDLKNINMVSLTENDPFKLTSTLTVKPFLVPHRDEFSETVGFQIQSAKKSIIFIPDINKWDVWNTSIKDVVLENDLSILDATFFDQTELPGRNMSEIPHPFVIESEKIFDSLSPADKSKIMFIHFNHSNPLLNQKSKAFIHITEQKYQIAQLGNIILL